MCAGQVCYTDEIGSLVSPYSPSIGHGVGCHSSTLFAADNTRAASARSLGVCETRKPFYKEGAARKAGGERAADSFSAALAIREAWRARLTRDNEPTMRDALRPVALHGRRSNTRASYALAALALLLCLGITPLGHAFDSLFKRMPQDQTWASVLGEYESRAQVEDDFMIGVGTEHVHKLPDGKLSVERKVVYTHVRRNDTKAVAQLPEPWTATGKFLLEPNLRIVRGETKLQMARSGDTVFRDYKLSEHHDWLYKFDQTVLRSYANGRRLQLQEFRAGKVTDTKNYDYPPNSAPLEVIGLYIAVAVQRGLEQFDFDLVAPGGDVHGIRTNVVRTRDVSRFSEGYSVPKDKLQAKEPLAVVDMRLASPIKYLFFPHHFYMAFSAREPTKLMMVWGGDPSAQLQAYRIGE
jgi:hypothetical protein